MASEGDKPSKSMVYSRTRGVQDGNLEGTSFPSASTEESSASGTRSARNRASKSKSKDDAVDDELKKLLGDLPERLSDTAGLGNMPELTMMLEDDEVIAKFEDKETARLLREISMDPSKLEELKTTPEIKWMLDMIQEKKRIIMTEPRYAQYRDKLQPDPDQTQANTQQMPFQM